MADRVWLLEGAMEAYPDDICPDGDAALEGVRLRRYSWYGSRTIPAAASAMPVALCIEADDAAVIGCHRFGLITMGRVSCLVEQLISKCDLL